MVCKPGDILCGCTLLRKCGSGAYGEVWLAEDAIGARVALKILYDRGRYSERELTGLKNYRDCNHPNLLKIRSVEITGDHVCYTMDAADDIRGGKGEYLPDTLAKRLELHGRMDGKDILSMLDGLLDGLEELHKHGLVHRDIKPDNILWVNGRPTLADAGLIAPCGKGSLVGTVGFMSPRLLSGKGQPDTSDDFYALGKVLYCALTGLPVGEYPSIPENMTISMDAALGHALRESCKQPVRSSAEDRKLLQEKSAAPEQSDQTENRRTSSRPKKPHGIRILLLLFLIAALSAGGFYIYSGKKKTEPGPYVMTTQEEAYLDEQLKETEEKLAAAQAEMQNNLQSRKMQTAAYLKDVQERAVTFLRKEGFIPADEDRISTLLLYRTMTGKEIIDLLWYSDRDPRLQPTAGVSTKNGKSLSGPEMDLFEMFSVAYPDFDRKKVLDRQSFWRARSDRSGMLETDPVMQAVALDSIILNEVNNILMRKAFRKGERERLKTLFTLRRGLIQPEFGGPDLSAWSCFND